MQLIDTHAHLDLEQFSNDLPEVLQRCREQGVHRIICPGITADSSLRCIELAEQYPDIIAAAVGIQPNSCAEAKPDDWERIVAMARRPGVVAIGEIGLDRYWDFTPFEMQLDYFDRQIRLAQELDLPVIIHSRETDADLLPALREAVERGPLRGVIHAFSTNRETALACIELGMHISFAGSVTYLNKKFAPLWDAAPVVPDDRLLVETDSPYMTPHPLRGKVKRCEPYRVRLTVERLAALREQSPEQIAQHTTDNALRLFRL